MNRHEPIEPLRRMLAQCQVRCSITLPAQIAQQVDRMAKRRHLSDNRVLVALIEEGIEGRRQKEKAFFQLAEKFRAADDPRKKRLGSEHVPKEKRATSQPPFKLILSKRLGSHLTIPVSRHEFGVSRNNTPAGITLGRPR
jgi:hypothetical protein